MLTHDDWYRGPTELVQQSSYRWGSQRGKGAASHIIFMVWLYRSPILYWEKGGILLVHLKTTCLRGAQGKKGKGNQHHVVRTFRCSS